LNYTRVLRLAVGGVLSADGGDAQAGFGAV